MDIERLLVFAVAYFAVLVLPGPAVAALIARVLTRGPAGSFAYIAGLAAGALVWFAVAAGGLAAAAAAYDGLFVLIRYAGAAWLLYVAYRLWTAPPHPLPANTAPADSKGLFLAGLALNLGNPKSIGFFLALLPNVIALDQLTFLAVAELALVLTAVVACVLGGYVLLATRMRRLFVSSRAVRLINRGSGMVVAGAAAAVVAR
jgi:threonine/homoserine/homoserine lactone efflux protein